MQILYAQHHWETAIFADDNWRYVLPTSEMPADWNTLSFDNNIWDEGPGGFGYSDGDDGTIINTTISVYLRTDFFVTDVTKLSKAVLSADYDDGFIAYITAMK